MIGPGRSAALHEDVQQEGYGSHGAPQESPDGATSRERDARPAAYDPSSEAKQADSTGDPVRPGTGGPDSVGDLPVPPEDDLDPAAIVERGEPRHRAGGA